MLNSEEEQKTQTSSEPELQPSRPLELLKNAFVIYGKGFLKFVIPVIVVEAVIIAIMYGITFWILYTNFTTNNINVAFVVILTVYIIYTVICSMLIGFLYIVIASYKLTGKFYFSYSLLLFRSRFVRLMGAIGLLWLVLIGVSIICTLFLLVPILGIVLICLVIGPLTIFFMIKWIFVIHVVVIEGRSPGRAFSKSSDLVEDMWWRTFGMVLLVYVIPSAIAYGLNYVCGLINPYLFVFGTILAMPLGAIGVTLLYYDMRARYERVGVQHAIDELDMDNIKA